MKLTIFDGLGFGFRLRDTISNPFKDALDVDYTRINDDVAYGAWEGFATVTQWQPNGNYFGNGLMWWLLQEFNLVEDALPFQSVMSYNLAHSSYSGYSYSDSDLYRDNEADFIFRVNTSHDDIITGNKYRDVVNAGRGDDRVSGMNGSDKLIGNAGRDSLYGDDGNDKLFGGGGNDLLSGGAGHDVLKGGKGDDKLILSGGSDKLFGGVGSDTFAFSFSFTTVQGQKGKTVIKDFDVDEDYIDLGNLEDVQYVEVNRGLVIKGNASNEFVKVLLLDIEQSDLTIDNYIL